MGSHTNILIICAPRYIYGSVYQPQVTIFKRLFFPFTKLLCSTWVILLQWKDISLWIGLNGTLASCLVRSLGKGVCYKAFTFQSQGAKLPCIQVQCKLGESGECGSLRGQRGKNKNPKPTPKNPTPPTGKQTVKPFYHRSFLKPNDSRRKCRKQNHPCRNGCITLVYLLGSSWDIRCNI